ncbi:hypothetical protein B0T10DRAFT_595998 [Thelonectria olida]|uniref:Uncharacterized protein n=1 Tax=Thelonectria olida TaxID=1576542 RepID=A0A9P9AGP6_9HYPO|nr:hypothetical protein B0T10DRAFT_595998 [Thelonectria olida]
MKRFLHAIALSARQVITRRRALVVIVCHIILTTSILIYTIKTLSGHKLEKEGIFKVSFGQQIFGRGFSNPVESIKAQATDAIAKASQVVTGATDAVGKATSVAAAQATKVENDVNSIVHSAIGAVETLLGGQVPKGCSVGTQDGCVIFESRSKCVQVPIKKDSIFAKMASLNPSIESLGSLLQHIPPLQMFLYIGLALVFVSSLISIIGALMDFHLPFQGLVNFILSMLGFISLLVFAAVVLAVYSWGLQLEKLTEGTLHKGGAYAASITMAVLSFLHLAVVTAEVVIGY